MLSAIVSRIDKQSLDRQSSTRFLLGFMELPQADLIWSLSAKTLITFFVDKLSDPTALIPSCNALIGLTESPGFGTGEGMEVARGYVGNHLLSPDSNAISIDVRYSL